MQQERQMILRMLAEGKITPEEAAALLDSLEAKPEAAARGGTAAGAGEGLVEGLVGMAGRVASWGAEFGAKVAEEIREGRVPVLKWIGDCFDGRESVTERAGRFERDTVEIDCACEAGSFILRGGDGPEYRLAVKQRFGQAEGPAIMAAGDRLTLRGNGIVHGEITLPDNLRYRLRLRSHAGRLEVDRLTVEQGSIITEAGSVRLAQLSAEDLTVKSSAGSVEGIGLAARNLNVATHCGRIHLELAPTADGRCLAETDVGAVSIVVPMREEVGYRLRARANLGQITCGPEFTISDDDRSIGQRRLVAETPALASREHRIELEVRAECGSIRVSGRR
ncbi:MAG: SHOCT-like domain-containing protein [Bacteroidota bacterium]